MGQELGATSGSREVCPRTPQWCRRAGPHSILQPPSRGTMGGRRSSALILKLRRRAAGHQKTPNSSHQRGEPSPEGKVWRAGGIPLPPPPGKCLGTAPGGLFFHHSQDAGLAAPKLVSAAERIRAGELLLPGGSGTPWQRRLRDIGPLSRYRSVLGDGRCSGAESLGICCGERRLSTCCTLNTSSSSAFTGQHLSRAAHG